jgi:hypothetical protein
MRFFSKLHTVICVTFLGLLLSGEGKAAGALTLGALVDSESGRGYDLDAWFAAGDHLSLSIGAGTTESSLEGAEFSGDSLRFGSDVSLGQFNVGVGYMQWEDSRQLRSLSTQLTAGWMSDSGVSLGVVYDDRDLGILYQVQTLTGLRDARVNFIGKGKGADIGYFGEQWSVNARYVTYSYGRTLQRVRNVIASANTATFPRIESLLNSVLTRSASAPEQELSFGLGRSLKRSSLRGQWLMQRDAISSDSIHSVSLRHGYKIRPSIELATTLGMTAGSLDSQVTYGGLSLTLRR